MGWDASKRETHERGAGLAYGDPSRHLLRDTHSRREPGVTYYYYPHFTGGEAEAQSGKWLPGTEQLVSVRGTDVNPGPHLTTTLFLPITRISCLLKRGFLVAA